MCASLAERTHSGRAPRKQWPPYTRREEFFSRRLHSFACRQMRASRVGASKGGSANGLFPNRLKTMRGVFCTDPKSRQYETPGVRLRFRGLSAPFPCSLCYQLSDRIPRPAGLMRITVIFLFGQSLSVRKRGGSRAQDTERRRDSKNGEPGGCEGFMSPLQPPHSELRTSIHRSWNPQSGRLRLFLGARPATRLQPHVGRNEASTMTIMPRRRRLIAPVRLPQVLENEAVAA